MDFSTSTPLERTKFNFICSLNLLQMKALDVSEANTRLESEFLSAGWFISFFPRILFAKAVGKSTSVGMQNQTSWKVSVLSDWDELSMSRQKKSFSFSSNYSEECMWPESFCCVHFLAFLPRLLPLLTGFHLFPKTSGLSFFFLGPFALVYRAPREFHHRFIFHRFLFVQFTLSPLALVSNKSSIRCSIIHFSRRFRQASFSF